MKMKAKKFTEEQLSALQDEASCQSTSYSVEKSADPQNYPVFDIPVNKKVLVYIPNHVVVNEEEGERNEELRMDTPIIHSIMDGRSFRKIRCIRGLSESVGYSGSCPFCDSISDCYTLANAQIDDACAQRGLNPENTEQDDVKAIRRKYFNARIIKNPDQYYTFPITVIETDEKNVKNVLVDENGVPKYRHMWYTCSAKLYEKKWEAALESMEDEPQTPAGRTFILDYTYESKSGSYDKMTSAKELTIIPKKMNLDRAIFEKWDEETEAWTPQKARETVYDNMFFEESDLEEEADRLMVPIREAIMMHKQVAIGGEAAPAIPLKKPATNGAVGLVDDDEDEPLPMTGQTDEG